MEDTLNQTLLVTAPHPDDDIIGAFGLMRAFPGKVIVWFMTDGGGGERRVEAMRALNDVGVESVVWHNLPFYRTKGPNPDPEDVSVARGVLAMASPTHLAACYDCDPKETHVKCLTVLQQAALSTQVHKSNCTTSTCTRARGPKRRFTPGNQSSSPSPLPNQS